MITEQQLQALKQALKPIQDKYIGKGRKSAGGTISAMLNRLGHSLDDIKELEAELMAAINGFINENGIELKDGVTEKITEISTDVLRAITDYRITGKLPE